MSAHTLLNRLDGVRGGRPGTWLAKCPAHSDKRASLSIREEDDGRVLVHCFAGCETDSVLGAVGLEFKGLFPERLTDHAQPKPRANRIPAGDLLQLVERELMVVAVVASDIQHKRAVSDTDWKRFEQAATVLMKARAELD